MSSQKWRNAGAPFTTEDGREVGTGDVFEASASSRDVRMRRKKLHPVAPGTPETVGEAQSVDQYHTGNGWYDIPGAGSVHGRKAAEEALGGEA